MREWCSGLVLSGGRGSRMGGADKGLVPWGGRPMVEWVCRQMRPLVAELAISCNRNAAIHASFCDLTLSDAHTDYPGPLAGILAGLRSLRGSHLLVAPCDLPAIDLALLDELQQLALAHPGRIAVVRQGDRLQPLLCVLADSTPSGHTVHAHPAGHSTHIWPSVPRPFGQAVGAQRRRDGIVIPRCPASSIYSPVYASIRP